MKVIIDGDTDKNASDIGNGPENDESLHEVGKSKDERSEEEITTSTDNENPSCVIEKELRRQGITLNELVSDNPRLSLDWQPFHGVTQCSCASPMDCLTRKYHCWNCGQVFCRRCIDYQTSLPGHYSENKVPVCKSCFKKIEKSKPTRTLAET